MTRSRALLVVLLLVGAVVSPLAGLGAAQEETPTPGANETRHVNPDETNRNGDLAGVQSALARRMAERLGQSSIQLSQGQYELADELVGEEYQDQYGKYVDVAGETDEEDSSGAFQTARERQERFNQNVREYNRKVEEYREAKGNGNEQRARRLARDLDRLSGNVSTTGTRLTNTYRRIGNASGVDMTDGMVAVNETAENVTEMQSEIRLAEFEATTLTVTRRSDRAAFDEPLVLDGRLATENGTAVANREVVLRINGQRLRVTTNDTGRFTARYRPVTTPVGDATAVVRYVPADTSPYLGAQATTDVTVSQTDSTITVDTAPDRAGFGEAVGVSGTVTAAGSAVPGVPVVVSIGGTRLATTNTTADGEFSFAPALPASIATGDRDLRVFVPLEKRAIAGSNTTRSLTVTETPTNLTLSADASPTAISLSGRLQTASGAGVPGQELEVRRNGSVVATARTNAEGRYTVHVPADAEERYRLDVRYAASTTNLGNASAAAVVTVPPMQGGDGSQAGGGGQADGSTVLDRLGQAVTSGAVFVGTGILLLVGVLAGGWWWFRTEESEDVASPSQAVESAVTRVDPEDEPLASARASLDESSDAAIERAYRTIRSQLRADGVGSDAATHWEFYRACVGAGIDHTESLETLTRLYERAAFDPSDASHAEAETALDSATQFLVSSHD